MLLSITIKGMAVNCPCLEINTSSLDREHAAAIIMPGMQNPSITDVRSACMEILGPGQPLNNIGLANIPATAGNPDSPESTMPSPQDSADLGKNSGGQKALAGIAAAAMGDITVRPLQKEWVRTFDRYVGRDPAFGPDNTLIASSSEKSMLYSLDRKTGATKWEFEGTASGFTEAAAMDSGGTIYASCFNDKTVYAIDGKTGHELWRYDAASNITSNIVTDNKGSLYFGEYGGVEAVSTASKKRKWRIDLPEHINSATMGPDSTLYLGCGHHSNDYAVYAIDTKAGKVKWRFNASGNFETSPAIGPDGTVYIGNSNWKFYAINGATGKEKWSKRTGGSFLYSRPALDHNGTVYFGCDDGHLYAVNGKNGHEVWEKELGGWLRSSPVLDRDGALYIPAEEKFTVLDSKNGDIKGEVKIENMFNHFPKPLIDEDGTLYTTSYTDVIAITSLRKSVEMTEKNYQKALETAQKEASGEAASGNAGPSAVIKDGDYLIVGGIKLEVKKEQQDNKPPVDQKPS